MFGISISHIIIVGIILLLFGPKRLPEIGQSLGRAIRKFKDAWEGVQEPEFRHIDSDRQTDASKPSSPTQKK